MSDWIHAKWRKRGKNYFCFLILHARPHVCLTFHFIFKHNERSEKFHRTPKTFVWRLVHVQSTVDWSATLCIILIAIIERNDFNLRLSTSICRLDTWINCFAVEIICHVQPTNSCKIISVFIQFLQHCTLMARVGNTMKTTDNKKKTL